MAFSNKFKNSRFLFFPLSLSEEESRSKPIIGFCRKYCAMAVATVLVISVCISINSLTWKGIDDMQTELFREGLSNYIFLARLGYFINWVGFFLLAGAIFYGFKIVRQARSDSRNIANILKEAGQRSLEIAALYKTSQDASAQHDLSALLKNILERSKRMLSAAGCAIFLYDSEHGDFEIMMEVGVGMPIGTRLSRHEGLAGRVAQTLEPLIVNDYAKSPFRSKMLKHLSITAAMCVPMVRGGTLLGVLGVHEVGKTDRKFTKDESRILSLFADDAAGALQNARLLEAFRNSEERFRIAAQCASDIVYDWNLEEGHVEYFGSLFERMRKNGRTLPKTREEYWNMIHHEDRERVRLALKTHLERGGIFSEEYRISDGNNGYVSISDRATAIRDQNNEPVRLIGTVCDITERKQAEQMKSDFVSFVTHQLRTPLSGVKWMLELATEERHNIEEIQSYIQDARISTDRLIGLVNDLLDISRLEQGRLEVTFEQIDLTDLTNEVVNEISPLLSEKKQMFSIQVADNLPSLYADAQLLRQVIINLVSNAIKYTPIGGEIKIQMTCEMGEIHWIIRDSGIGISRPNLGKLFKKFYRAENAVVVETEGTGLGLYLVRLIVEQLGGNVWCESEEGVGSTFEFTLPVAA
jgi:PAS domain S-box-containing protein